jgi:predicted transcriptional regulator/DNA-binding XRE family transcriptional regulator
MTRSLTGTRIRERRRNKKLSQTELARKVGISASYLNLIEHNRRGIAGKTLLSIAETLEVDARSLSEGADRAHILKLQEAAANHPDAAAELDRLEEFIGRFPGWAKLLDQFQSETKYQRESLLALSDRLNNDPFFAEAIHMMLSNITAIHSTANILADDGEVPEPLKSEFLRNMEDESARLAKTAGDLIRHFDAPAAQEQVGTQISVLDQFFEKNGFHLPDLETGASTPQRYLEGLEDAPEFDRKELLKALTIYKELADALPLDPFLERAQVLNFDPLQIADAFGVDLDDVMRRLAHLPRMDTLPEFGYLKVDGSGGVLFRKELTTLHLPKFSSACPLWPVYRCFGQPGQPVRCIMNTPTGESFLTYSVAKQAQANSFGLPPSLSGTMIFTTDFDMFLPRAARLPLPSLDVGLHCSVCPRANCGGRRNGYILQ